MKKYSAIAIGTTLIASALCSCGEKGWTIEGAIEGCDSTTLYLEALSENGWYIMDSVILNGNDNFEFTQPAMGYPEIFRIKANNHIVYVPIDSIETITFSGYASAIDSAYTLKGSTSAEMMMSIDQKIAAVAKKGGEKAVATDSVLKRELSGVILGDNIGLVSYYIINKRVGNTLIFDPANKSDIRTIGAVANKFNDLRPNDPRTQILKKTFLENRRVSTTNSERTFNVSETSLFDIKLYDNKGTLHSLTETAAKGKVVLLNFTIYGAQASPAFNIQLNKIYEANKDNLEIFQVSVDEDEAVWKSSADNLPWITVYAPYTEQSKHLSNYNVGALPATFIINRKGELVERVDDISKLESTVKKHL